MKLTEVKRDESNESNSSPAIPLEMVLNFILRYYLSQRIDGYIDVDDGCWRRNVLMATIRC